MFSQVLLKHSVAIALNASEKLFSRTALHILQHNYKPQEGRKNGEFGPFQFLKGDWV